MFLAFDTLAGLPGHALLVHGAVVLVPLGVVALIVTCWKAEWRAAYSLPVMLMSVAGAVFAFAAKQSGEPLEESVKQAAREAGVQVRFGEHPENGDTAFFFAMIFGLTTIAVWAASRYGKKYNLPTWAPLGTYGVAVVVGVISFVTMLIAGHSGAGLVWKDVGSFTAGK
jgi:hypothetical protein